MPKVILTGIAEKDGNQFTAICPELDVASCGDSVEEALDMLEEALEVYLEAVHDVGELAREFEGMGIKVHPDEFKTDGVSTSPMHGARARTYILQVPDLVVV